VVPQGVGAQHVDVEFSTADYNHVVVREEVPNAEMAQFHGIDPVAIGATRR
jgi:hypothetical protein